MCSSGDIYFSHDLLIFPDTGAPLDAIANTSLPIPIAIAVSTLGSHREPVDKKR